MMAEMNRKRGHWRHRPAIRTLNGDGRGPEKPGGSGERVHEPRSDQDGSRTARYRGGKKRVGSRMHSSRTRMPKRNIRPSFSMGGRKKEEDIIPPLAKDAIRVIPLGGVEEVGRNMSLIEYGDDIIVVDCGFQFTEVDTPGIDYILPNTKYLEDRAHKVRAMAITHGHLDHIGAIPFVIDRIGNPPIYTRRLTSVMIKKRQEEFPHLPPLDIREVETKETIVVSENLKLRFFAVTHTIPDAMGIIIDTPHGSIVHTGDLKLDHVDGNPSEAEKAEFKQFEAEKVLLLMADSTNVERPGFSIPEWKVWENMDEIIKNGKGRLIIGTFASQLERIVKIIAIAEKYKKKVVIEGRSMKTNIEIVRELGILKPRPDTIIGVENMGDYPPERIIVLATGAQGDAYAALMRTANKTHKYLKITPNDTVVLSSSVIPGNERAVQKLKDNLSRQGAHIITYQVSDVHSSGHANRDETAWIHSQIKPRFFIPLHGYHYMLRVHVDIAMSLGIPAENAIIPDNGSIIEIQGGGERMVKLPETAPAGMRMVDGTTVGDIQEVVIRDRQTLAQDGMFVIVASLNLKTGKLRKSPDLISRGFVYLRESQELLQETRLLIKKCVEDTTKGMNPINFDYVKDKLTETVERYLLQKTSKRPIVIPVILGM